RFPAGSRPGGVHDLSSPDTSRERKTAGQGFAQANDIGRHLYMFAGKPFPGPAEPGVNLVQDQQNAMFVAKLAQSRQEPVGRKVDAAAYLDRFNQDCPDLALS